VFLNARERHSWRATFHAHWLTGVFLRIGLLNLLHGEVAGMARAAQRIARAILEDHQETLGATGKVRNDHFINLAFNTVFRRTTLNNLHRPSDEGHCKIQWLTLNNSARAL
jgi:hypothetical protein